MARLKYKEAAKLEVKRGKPPIGKKPEKKDLQMLYIRELKSIREIAEILICSKDMVYRALQEYKIKIREKSRTKESALSRYALSELEERVKKEGYRQAAKKLGIGSSTLYFYIKRRKGS
jgi:transposase